MSSGTVAVRVAGARLHEGEGRLAQRLRGDGARVGGGAAGHGLLLDERDLLAVEGSLDRAVLARRAAPDDHHVVVEHGALIMHFPCLDDILRRP